MKKNNQTFEKEAIRGTIKEIMRVRGLRSISISNYNRWKNLDPGLIHSIKLSLEDGYLYVYGYNKNSNRAGEKFSDVTMKMYQDIYNTVHSIMDESNKIPSSVKRNILVKISR